MARSPWPASSRDRADRGLSGSGKPPFGGAKLRLSSEGPLFGPILRALRNMGISPYAPLARIPYGWGLVYRGCGRITVERTGEREALVTQHDAPPAMRGSLRYLEGVAGTMDGLMIIGGANTARAEIDVAGDRVRYPSWTV